MQATALRNQLKNLLENNSNGFPESIDTNQQYYDDIDLDTLDKRSLSALARNGLLHTSGSNSGKRNVASMARLGLMRPTQDDIKRSIATLAKNGQLPSREPETEDLGETQWNDYKRNIGSLARSGHIAAGKRNIAALARDFELPANGKRNLPSILRLGGNSNGQQQQPKRNVAALARGNFYPYYHQNRNEKRDVNAVNHKRRTFFLLFYFTSVLFIFRFVYTK